jgi:hypothetical protein
MGGIGATTGIAAGFTVTVGTDWTVWTSAPSGRGKMGGGGWMGGIGATTGIDAGFRVTVGTDWTVWTSTPSGRGEMGGGCWMGGNSAGFRVGLKVGSCSGGACVSESDNNEVGFTVEVNSAWEVGTASFMVDSSFIESSSKSLPVLLVPALGPSSVVSRFKVLRLRSSGAYIRVHISTT